MGRDASSPVAYTAQTRLLVIAPHPDDETLGAGILIQRVREVGGRVDIVLLTDGDNNPWPQRLLERRLRIGGAGRTRWAARRRQELALALRELDVPADGLHALGWPDQGLVPLLLQPGNDLVPEIAALITALQPTLVVAPALADRHPDHGTAHVLVRLALALTHLQPLLWTYMVHGRELTGPSFVVDGSAAQRTAKQAALAAHASQLALGRGRLQRMAARPERFAPVVVEVGSGSCLPWFPPWWLRPWLRLDLVCLRGVQRWTWAHAPLRLEASCGFSALDLAGTDGAPHFARLSLPLRSPWIFDHWGWAELE